MERGQLGYRLLRVLHPITGLTGVHDLQVQAAIYLQSDIIQCHGRLLQDIDDDFLEALHVVNPIQEWVEEIQTGTPGCGEICPFTPLPRGTKSTTWAGRRSISVEQEPAMPQGPSCQELCSKIIQIF